MEMLSKEDLLFKRDEKGELIPKEIELKAVNRKIKITPITFGEFQEYQTQIDKITGIMPTELSLRVIKKHLIEPKLADDELKDMSSTLGNLILMEILRYSSIIGEKIAEEDDIKNLEQKKRSIVM